LVFEVDCSFFLFNLIIIPTYYFSWAFTGKLTFLSAKAQITVIYGGGWRRFFFAENVKWAPLLSLILFHRTGVSFISYTLLIFQYPALHIGTFSTKT
jgi:hypothetical protein